MSFDIRYPKITATTEKGQLEQIRTYLFQLVDNLKWALNAIDTGNTDLQQNSNQPSQNKVNEDDPKATFNSIKALIIKSADIVDAYYEEFTKRLEGQYVAQSDFGIYVENTVQTITEDSKSVETLFESIQEIISDVKNIESSLIEVNARIKAGFLYYDDNEVPIYGIEIGQINEINGEEVFNKFAQFTSDRLSFYDQTNTEVAYISDNKLFISNIEVLVSIKKGNLVEYILANGDTVTKCLRKV